MPDGVPGFCWSAANNNGAIAGLSYRCFAYQGTCAGGTTDTYGTGATNTGDADHTVRCDAFGGFWLPSPITPNGPPWIEAAKTDWGLLALKASSVFKIDGTRSRNGWCGCWKDLEDLKDLEDNTCSVANVYLVDTGPDPCEN